MRYIMRKICLFPVMIAVIVFTGCGQKKNEDPVRLIVYWCVVILTLFLATVLLLSIIGVLPGMDFKVREMLSAQQKNTLSAMTEQTDIMMARSISLSEDITKELNQCLTANGKTFSDLNDNPQLIMDLESALYPSLKSALDVKYCSGVFVVLDATVNTKTEYADTSRMGIYLRLSDLKAVNTSKQHVVFSGEMLILQEQSRYSSITVGI